MLYLLVYAGTSLCHSQPNSCKTLVETQFLPHLESFFSSQSSTFYQTVDAAMLKSILVPSLVESTPRNDWLKEKHRAKSI